MMILSKKIVVKFESKHNCPESSKLTRLLTSQIIEITPKKAFSNFVKIIFAAKCLYGKQL
jgi:hypothetical protein